MMKRNILAVIVPALLAAGTAKRQRRTKTDYFCLMRSHGMIRLNTQIY